MFWMNKSYHPVSSDVELNNLQITNTANFAASKQLTWAQRRLKGWRFGVLSGALLAATVLILNFAVTIAALNNQDSSDSRRRLLFEGDCTKAERLNVVAHLLINAMSTILLSASNYGMQCLSAPTRNEIDVAHASKRWLDIGVLSVRNIKTISLKRSILWALLGLSSLPLHLFYNSAVFSTVTAYEYIIFSARPSMLTAASSSTPLGISSSGSYYSQAKALYDKAMNGQLETLTASECINAYAITFQTERGNVILVTNDTGKLAGPRDYSNYDSAITPGSSQCASDPFDWICGHDATHICRERGSSICSVVYKKIDRNEWAPLGNKVDHCLSEKQPGHCKVQFSLTIAYVVIAFNFCKAAILLSIFLFVKENPLTTMGDAVSSFLRFADETTASLCLMSRDRLALWNMPPVPQPYTRGKTKRSREWLNTVSRSRWWFCMFLYALAIVTCTFLFFYGIIGHPIPASVLVSLPIGALNPSTFIFGWSVPNSGSAGVISNVLVANSPQVILSMIYYTYNSLFTCFLAGREWSQYAIQRKGLRVSSGPHGQQRSTYFLQLPYKVAFPLMALSGILHWLTSQGIFLVSVVEMREGDKSLSAEFLTCGYSPPAILAVVILGLFMVVVVTYFGKRRFKGSMPIVATCSACISASCHLPEEEKDADTAYRPVQWGVSKENVDVFGKDTVSHCSFSSLHVRLPEEGELCAGLETDATRKNK